MFSACGLFGGDEEVPEVVERPDSAAENAEEQTATGTTGASEAAEQQQEQPTEAVTVTTSPPDEEEEEQEAAEESEAEEVDPTIYVVQAGDTLAAIANRLGVRIDDLITLNGIQNPDVLHVGQELRIPGAEASDEAADEEQDDAEADEDEQEEQSEEEQIDPPSVELPTVAVPAATPTQVSHTQFPQPGPEQTTETIPDAPSNFLQYGAAALPWLHGINEVEPIIELFKAWPMPALAVGNDRVVLVDTGGNGSFSAAIVYTDPTSFGAAVPYSNLVVYDPVPGDPSKYRIAYDHALAYAREVQGIQQLADVDVTGDFIRDLTFREITCDDSGCVSSFYVLSSTGDGYRTVTGPVAQVAAVSAIDIEDLTGDGVADIVVDGLATDQETAARYTFVFSAQGDNLVEAARLSLDGGGSEESEADEDEDDTLEE
ncbi:MAG: LysM peptidoglycan-binding domain-containing protein [Chloroflexota bacterium]|nr:LysM peptidoglycan-binding domain-containing protein [Chloroflexota bacterium]